MGDFFKSEYKILYERGAISYEEYIILRSDGRFSRAIVSSAIIAIMIYAFVMFQFTFLNIQNHTTVYPPVEFTTGYFAFWTVEIVMLASIKKHNIKNKHENESGSKDIVANILRRISPGGSEKVQSEAVMEDDGR